MKDRFCRSGYCPGYCPGYCSDRLLYVVDNTPSAPLNTNYGVTIIYARRAIIEIGYHPDMRYQKNILPPKEKPFLIIQLRPEYETANSEFAAILQYGELRETEVVRARVERIGLPDINLNDYAAIIVGGSPFDVSTPAHQKNQIQKKIETGFMRLFENVLATDFPFLGACSGSGLLGSFCGANISTKYAEPVGGVDITLTAEGKKDPLLSGFPTTFRVLLGHKEACDETPPGAILLARSAACPVQMFRVKNNIYATQFHPEGDCEGFAVRIKAYKHHGYFPAETAEQLIAMVANEDTPIAQQMLCRFVKRYRTQGK